MIKFILLMMFTPFAFADMAEAPAAKMRADSAPSLHNSFARMAPVPSPSPKAKMNRLITHVSYTSSFWLIILGVFFFRESRARNSRKAFFGAITASVFAAALLIVPSFLPKEEEVRTDYNNMMT